MRFIFLFLPVLMLSACGTFMAHETLVQVSLQDCYDLPAEARQACEDRKDVSYRESRQQREAFEKELQRDGREAPVLDDGDRL